MPGPRGALAKARHPWAILRKAVGLQDKDVNLLANLNNIADFKRTSEEFSSEIMSLTIITRSNKFTPFSNHEADGARWHTMPDSVMALLTLKLEKAAGDFPQLSKIRPAETIEFVGAELLEALILECELIPGTETDFRLAMGKIHGAACQAWAADMVLCIESAIDTSKAEQDGGGKTARRHT